MSKDTPNLPVLPGGFQTAPVIYNDQCNCPYVTFSNQKKTIYPALIQKIPLLRDGDPVLVAPDPALPVKLPLLKYFLVGLKQFWGKYDNVGKLTDVVLTFPGRQSGFTEIFETVAIVFVGDTLLVPASIRFKGAQTPGVIGASKALDQAETPEWLGLSKQHAATAGIEVPWARFTATTTKGNERETKPNTKKEVFKYQTLEKCALNPTNAKEYALLKSFFATEEFKETYALVLDNFTNRCENAEALVKGEAA